MEEESQDVDMIRSDQSSSATVGYGTRVWSKVSFANKVRESKVRPPIYTREGEIDDFDETYLPMFNQMGVGNEEAEYYLAEDYQEAWKPWKRRLILKLLGKSISLRALKNRVESLWNLQWGCDIVDLEEGFFCS